MFRIYDGREKFYQWDLNQKLIVEDAAVTEVHFCNRTDECSLVCETYTENDLTLVNVPNILLQQDWNIRVYAVCEDCTKAETVFKVVRRTKPSDYIYTETEVKNYEQYEERLKALEERKLTAEDVGAVSTEGGRMSGGLLIFGGENGSTYIDNNGQIQFRTPDGENSVNIAMELVPQNKRKLHFFGENDETVELVNIAPPTANDCAANKGYVDEAVTNKNRTNLYCSIPSDINLLVGNEFRIYYRNVLTREDTTLWFGYATNLTTKYYTDYLSIVATSSGSFTLPWAVFDAGHTKLAQGQIVVKATDKKPVGTTTAIVIGDSTVNAGVMTAKAAELYKDNGGELALCGTRGNGTHEGRGGWTAEDYCTKENKDGIDNAFYNDGFDFSYYMDTQGFEDVQAVVIQLGINDVFGFREYYSWCLYDSSEILEYMNNIVNSIQEYDDNIKIIFNLPTLPNSDGVTFAENYGTNQIYWVYRHNIIRFARELQEYFAGRRNIYFSASNCILDTKTQIRDGVHPTDEGYDAMGQRLYEILVSLVDGVVYIKPLLSIEDRERVSTKNTISTTAARELDYNKCYDTSFGGVRSSNVSDNITGYTVLSDNSFSCTVTKNTGNGLEFPIELEAGKTYKLSWAADNASTRAYLMKYNADTTYNTNVHLGTGAGTKTATFTAEENIIYSVCFPVLINNVECTFSDISLVEV